MTDNDQAAVEALSKIKYETRGKHAQGSWAQEYTIRPEAARAILDAIRKGEVPGVCDPRHVSALYDQRSAEVEREKARADKAENDLREWKYALSGAQDEIAKWKVGNDQLRAERDRLAGLLREVKRYADPHWPFDPNDRRNCINRIDSALTEIGGGK